MNADKESERIAALRRSRLLERSPHPAIQQLVSLAARLSDMPLAFLSLVDQDHVRLAVGHGLSLTDYPRRPGLCASTILGDEPLIIADTLENPHAATNPLVTGKPHLRCYTGIPVAAAGTWKLGALCVGDLVPRVPDQEQIKTLQELAAAISAIIDQQPELEHPAHTSQAQADALLALTQSNLIDHADGELRMDEVSSVVARTIGAARVSLWRFTPDRKKLLCEELYDAVSRKHSSGFELDLGAAPSYHRALQENRTIAATDALEDARTAELATAYLQPLGIGALLDAPILINGVLAGVLCIEHTGGRREWRSDEQSFALAVANLYALMIAQRIRMRSEARLRTILDSEPECVQTTSLSGDLLSMNPAGLAMIGATNISEIAGMPATGLIHPADRRACLALHRRVCAGEPGRLRFRMTGLKGTERWMETHATPLRKPDGSIEGVLSVIRDISEQVASQQALRERIKELRCLYRVLELTTDDSRSPDEVCADIAVVLPGSLLYQQHAVARILIGEKEIRSHYWSTPARSLQRVITSEKGEIGQVEIGYTELLPDQNGGFGPFLTEEASLLEAVATHIGRMFNDRHRTDLLRQSERLRAVGELTGGIAHDFNNLLQVIVGNAELLGEALRGQEPLEEMARSTQEAAVRGAELTSRLLAFSRRQALDPRVTSLNELLEGMDSLLRRTLGSHIEISIDAGPDLWPAMIDPPQLENAILNLCINARDAMPKGGKLSIRLRNITLDERSVSDSSDIIPGDYVLLSVSDTGTGMPPEVLSRVFEPFFTTKEVGQGSGLGLSMVYGFTKQSRGHITISSTPGSGTTVWLYLPRATRGRQAAARAEIATGSGQSLQGGGEQILVVEDDQLIRTHVASELTALGYRVTLAEQGAQALGLLESGQRFDLLFTDLLMPGGINGLQLAERARQICPELRVLFTSGYAENTLLSDAAPRQDIPLLSKPYRRQALALKVREALLRD